MPNYPVPHDPIYSATGRQRITVATDLAISSCSASADQSEEGLGDWQEDASAIHGGSVDETDSNGPIYQVVYSAANNATVMVGDWVTAYKMEVALGEPYDLDAENWESIYTYKVVKRVNNTTLWVKYITDSASSGDDSPCDLPDGEGSSGSPGKAPHTFTRDLGGAFMAFVE